MKYTHDRTTELFDTIEEAEEDRMQALDFTDYAEAVSELISISDILVNLFNRKNNDEFAYWLDDVVLQAENELVENAIYDVVEEEEENF